MNLSLQQGVQVSQQLNLAPQLLQWLRLLQSPATELSQLVQKELESNPALEIDENRFEETEDAQQETNPNHEEPSDPPTLETGLSESQIDKKYEFLAENDSDYWKDSMTAGSAFKQTSDKDAQERYEFHYNSITTRDSLREHLLKQLPFSEISADNIKLVELIIGSLDERGYLDTNLEDLSAISSAPIEQLQAALSVIQGMTPKGVAARDLRECLLLQTQEYNEHSTLRLIIRDYLDALGRRQYHEIATILDVSEEDVIEAFNVIRSLNPNPGEKFIDNTARYITADITINKQDGKYAIKINNDHIPHLRISSSCKRLLSKPDLGPEEMSYIRNKIRSANFIIQGIKQRQETIRKVTEQIVQAQREFLDTEKGKLQPLTMAKLASIIGVHETTVSRAIANKYIKTPRGLFPMKHFFWSGYHCADGSSMTPEAVKELISGEIENENTDTPLTDIQISGFLKKKGLRVARRTIAKYRDEMSIPSSKERKQTNVRFYTPPQKHRVTTQTSDVTARVV